MIILITIINRSSNPDQKTRSSGNKKQKTCHLVDFTVSEDYRINQRKRKERKQLEFFQRTKKCGI